MIFEALGDIAWWALQIAVVAAFAIGLIGYPAWRLRQRRLPAPRWRAEVRTAQTYGADSYSGYTSVKPVRGEVAVRVVRGGEFLTIGTVSTSGDNFEDELNGLVAAAEERAAALNAHEVILRG